MGFLKALLAKRLAHVNFNIRYAAFASFKVLYLAELTCTGA
jgi:hypothetical protein